MTSTEIVLTSRHQRVLGVTLLRIKALRCFSQRAHAFQRRLILATFCYMSATFPATYRLRFLLRIGYVSCYVSATFPATYQLRVGYKAAGPAPFWHQRMRLAHLRSLDEGPARIVPCQINPRRTWPGCGPSNFCQPSLPD